MKNIRLHPPRSTVAVACVLAAVFPLSRTSAQEPQPPGDLTAKLDALAREVAELRDAVTELNQTLDAVLQSVINELRKENERLRAALRDQFTTESGGLPNVPRPDRELLEQVLADSPPQAHDEAPREFSYTVVKEWRRTPEQAAELGGKAESLIGMIVAVPEWSTEQDLVGLGRRLRAEYATYDNINIEVFKNVAAAFEFADRGVTHPEDRVLNVSKFKADGRDLILLIQNGRAREVQ